MTIISFWIWFLLWGSFPKHLKQYDDFFVGHEGDSFLAGIQRCVVHALHLKVQVFLGKQGLYRTEEATPGLGSCTLGTVPAVGYPWSTSERAEWFTTTAAPKSEYMHGGIRTAEQARRVRYCPCRHPWRFYANSHRSTAPTRKKMQHSFTRGICSLRCSNTHRFCTICIRTGKGLINTKNPLANKNIAVMEVLLRPHFYRDKCRSTHEKPQHTCALAVRQIPKMLLHIGLLLCGGLSFFSLQLITVTYSKRKQLCSKNREFWKAPQ